MNQIATLADEDVRRTLKALSADIQASLALSRATLQAVAAISPALNAVAERALDDEADRARESAAPRRVADIIEDARARLVEAPAEMARMSALEQALLAAADALPDARLAAVRRRAQA